MTNQLLAELEILQQAKDNLQKDYQEAVDKINNMKLDIDQAQEIIIELQQENKQLKEDKKKAIEWVNNHINKYQCKGITIIDWDELSNTNDL